MDIIEKLLKKSKEELTNTQTAEVEIERLTELIGEPCIFKIRGLTNKEIKEIRELNTKKEWRNVKRNGKTVKEEVEVIDTYKLGLDTIVEATVEPNFRDSRLREKFGTEIPTDIVEEMLMQGEIIKIANTIKELIGEADEETQQDVDEEVKN